MLNEIKELVFILIFVIISLTFFCCSDIYGSELEIYKTQTQNILNEKYSYDIASIKLQKLNYWFWNTKSAAKIVDEFVYKVWAKGDLEYNEFKVLFISHMELYFGKEVADFMWTIIGAEGFKNHIWDFYIHTRYLRELKSCPTGFRLVGGDMAYITTVCIIGYYSNIPFLGSSIGSLTASYVEYLIEKSKYNYKICALLVVKE
jgi:hypothetical protein